MNRSIRTRKGKQIITTGRKGALGKEEEASCHGSPKTIFLLTAGRLPVYADVARGSRSSTTHDTRHLITFLCHGPPPPQRLARQIPPPRTGRHVSPMIKGGTLRCLRDGLFRMSEASELGR
ncbi:hypothetical protein MRX96_044351 [Rhipicephalus microplus]